MDDKPTKRGGGAVVALVLVVVLVLLPMFYVLSIGPVIWMYEQDMISPSMGPALNTFYIPAIWIAYDVPVIGPVILRYITWCRPIRSSPV